MDGKRNTIMNFKTVTIFGTFDGIHEGHLAFIRDAKNLGDRIVAIIARDQIVEKLKSKKPMNDESSRIKDIMEVPEVDIAYLGDPSSDTYNILKEIKPDLIYLGYDQQELLESLKKAMKNKIIPKIEIKIGEAYKPEKFKSSIINKNERN